MVSYTSHESNTSNDSRSKLVRSVSNSPITSQRKLSTPSPASLKKKGSYSKLKCGSRSSLVRQTELMDTAESVLPDSVVKDGMVKSSVEWDEGEVFLANLNTGIVKLVNTQEGESTSSSTVSSQQTETPSETDCSETVVDTKKKMSSSEGPQVDPAIEIKGQDEVVKDQDEEVEGQYEEVEGQDEGVKTCVDPASITLRKKPAPQRSETNFILYMYFFSCTIYLHTHSITHTHTHSLTHTYTHSLTHSLTHSHTHTHSLTHSRMHMCTHKQSQTRLVL